MSDEQWWVEPSVVAPPSMTWEQIVLVLFLASKPAEAWAVMRGKMQIHHSRYLPANGEFYLLAGMRSPLAPETGTIVPTKGTGAP